MRTLNEQIQRVKDALVTCYNAIKRKGGTIPEAGERTLLNMPAAVLSIPQTHGVLTELNVTANGEYLPSDYDADGFSKVTAEFDTSSLPKVKVSNISVSNACLDRDGVWDGRQIDTSNMSTFFNTFGRATQLKTAIIDDWDTSNASGGQAFYSMFDYCTSLEYLNTSKWVITNAVNGMANMFSFCTKLKCIDTINWDASGLNSVNNMFTWCNSLESIIGNKTIDYVLENDIKCFRGLKINFVLNETKLDRASLRALINGLADLTDQTSQTLTLGATLQDKLTEEDIAIAVNKNWTVV